MSWNFFRGEHGARWREPPGVGRLAAVGVLLVVLTAIGPALHHRFGGIAHWTVVALTAAGACWAAFTSARLDLRGALLTIGVVALAMRLTLLFSTPYLSDDLYRYIWDGRVQAAGMNPYRYVPAAPELERLRDTAIYPMINRADYAPTIYPPAAQMVFLAITRFGESVLVMKLGLVLLELVAMAATIVILRRLDLPLSRIAAFAWHPLAVWEIAGNGHVDAAMLGLMLPGVVLFLSHRTLAAGAVVTAAALVKPIALLALPVFWRPWNFKLVGVVAATALVLYLPYLSVGSKVLGFLGGYIEEEELSRGGGFRYIMIAERLLGPLAGAAPWYLGVCSVLLVGMAVAVGFRWDRSGRSTLACLVILLTSFLVMLTPHYPWYYLALVPFLPVFPASWTLWLLTVGGLQTYQAIPGEIMPDYIDRQVVFHSIVLAAIARDAWAFGLLRAIPALTKTTGDLPT